MARDVERASETLLGRARQDLAEAERDEATERGALMGLIDRDRHLRYAMEQASMTIRTIRDVEGLRQGRARLDTLERERHALMASRRAQEMTLDQRRDRTRAARLVVEELEQRALRLRETIRHTEHQLLMRQRTIAELEGQVMRLLEELPRVRAQHAEAEGRLAGLRRELADLDGGGPALRTRAGGPGGLAPARLRLPEPRVEPEQLAQGRAHFRPAARLDVARADGRVPEIHRFAKAAHDRSRVVGVGEAEGVADLVRRELEEDRLARRLPHGGWLDEVDADGQADRARVVDVEVRQAERVTRGRGDEVDHDVGPVLPLLPAERLDAQGFPGDGVPVVDRPVDRLLERGVPRWDQVDREREAIPRMADRPGHVHRVRGPGRTGRGEHRREQQHGRPPACDGGRPRAEVPVAGGAGYGSGPATTTVARSGWRWLRAAWFTCWAVTAR
jgi:hypothetical protein